MDGDFKVQGNDAPSKWQVHCYYDGRGPIQQGKDVAMGKDTGAQGCHHCAWRFSHADDFFRSHWEVLRVLGNGGDMGRVRSLVRQQLATSLKGSCGIE